MGFRQAGRLLFGEVGQVGHERFAEAQAHGDDFAVEFPEVFVLKLGPQEMVYEVQQPGVADVDWRMHKDFAADEIGANARFQPVQEFLGSEERRVGECSSGHARSSAHPNNPVTGSA